MQHSTTNTSGSTTKTSGSTPNTSGWLALSPALIFLTLYVIVSLVIGDFYVMPITVALMAASAWSIAICRGAGKLSARVALFSRSAGNADVLYMVWIFIMAGAFAALAKSIGAIDATVGVTLRFFPPSLLLPAIFAGACFISMSIGTSVGTVVALVPLVVEIAYGAEGDVPLFVATVLGRAFFGDNLSFISDTTIAATRTQGCKMADKFRANFRIVFPAALITLGLYIAIGSGVDYITHPTNTPWWLMTPYMFIIAAALAGVNVLIVLLGGIVIAIGFGLSQGISLLDSCRILGEGVDSMGQLIIITVLAAGMLGMIKQMGGIDFMLRALTARVSGKRGAQACISVLVGIVNLCTANNTVAILTVGELSRDIAHRYGISASKTASLLDTGSCIVQCLIPYGAQTLLATSLAGISPAAPWQYLYYPWALTLMLTVSILITRKRRA